MKPTIEFNKEKKIIHADLKPNMSKQEIYEFIDDLHSTLADNQALDISLLTNASQKSFTDLDSAFELSESFRKLLEEAHIKKFAMLRPQADYYSENIVDYKDQFKTFTNEVEAEKWLNG